MSNTQVCGQPFEKKGKQKRKKKKPLKENISTFGNSKKEKKQILQNYSKTDENVMVEKKKKREKDENVLPKRNKKRKKDKGLNKLKNFPGSEGPTEQVDFSVSEVGCSSVSRDKTQGGCVEQHKRHEVEKKRRRRKGENILSERKKKRKKEKSFNKLNSGAFPEREGPTEQVDFSVSEVGCSSVSRDKAQEDFVEQQKCFELEKKKRRRNDENILPERKKKRKKEKSFNKLNSSTFPGSEGPNEQVDFSVSEVGCSSVSRDKAQEDCVEQQKCFEVVDTSFVDVSTKKNKKKKKEKNLKEENHKGKRSPVDTSNTFLKLVCIVTQNLSQIKENVKRYSHQKRRIGSASVEYIN